MPRMRKFILKAFLAITSGLSTQTLAEDGVPFETAKAIGRRVAWTPARWRSPARRTIGEPTVCAGRAELPLEPESRKRSHHVECPSHRRRINARLHPHVRNAKRPRAGGQGHPHGAGGLGLRTPQVRWHQRCDDQAGQHGPTSRHQPHRSWEVHGVRHQPRCGPVVQPRPRGPMACF